MKYQLTVKGNLITTFDAEDLHDIQVEVVAESSTEVPPPEPPKAARVKFESKWRDLNSRMKGEEGYTLAVDGERLVWLDQHPDAIVTYRGMQPKGIRASERRCHDTCEVPTGLIVILIKKDGGTTRYTAGRVQEDTAKPGQGSLYDNDGITHIGTRREGNSYVHILDIDGVRKEFHS
jgi:hypothetical protein